MKVWIDGTIVEGSEAKISVLDHGLLYGDGVFEGMRVLNRRVFRLNDHLHRLSVSAKAIGLTLPVPVEEIDTIVLKTARAFDQDEAYIRLIITRGEGPLGVDPLLCHEPRLICIVDELTMFPSEKMECGIDMITSSLRRPSTDILDPHVKSLNYLNNVLAKQEARLRGADDALLLNQTGMVSETSSANIFTVLHGVLTTPPSNDGALEGVTRDSVLQCATELGIPCGETTLSRYDLFKADEVFLTGTGARMVPVARLDGRPLGQPQRSPLTAQLRTALTKFSQANGTPF